MACGTLRRKKLKGKRRVAKEEGDAEREHKAMHEENFLSSWLREDVRGKKIRRRKLVRRMKRKGVKGGKQKRRKKRTKRRESKEEGTVYLWLRPLKSLVKGEIWRGVVVFPGVTCSRSLITGLIVSLILARMCVWCLM